MYKILLPVLLLFSTLLHAQEVIPGLIPRFYSIEASTDLQMSPEVAHQKALNGFDLSLLEPASDTNIWSPDQKTIPNYELIKKDETVRFVKELPSKNGLLRFTVVTQDNRELIIMLSKKIHTNLLRRNILAKLGYATQPMSWVARFKMTFADTIDSTLFKESMKDKLLAGTERWIKSEQDLNFVIQDGLVLTPESDIYNLASGVMPPEIHMNRRLLKAPYIPMALVDTTESINLFPWQAGRNVLNHIKLNHTQDLDTSYNASWEDARWIGRRMAKFTRQDFVEIVTKASFPPEAEKLLIEKIIARRNDLMELLDLKTIAPDISFNPQVSFGKGLKDGEIVQEFFDGYASRYSYGDPESPFSASELGSFALSRVQSEALDLAITKFNNLIGTDDEANYIAKIEEIVKKEGPYFPTTGIAVPTFHANLIISRDIVTGSYMGTNNKVQLVDTFGYSVDAGVFSGIEGLPFPGSIKAGAGVNFQRTFAHVKPVQSLKKSMKEKYKNMAVPLLLRQLGHKIDKLTVTQAEAQASLMQSVAQDLKASLGVGESFIVTDSIVPRMFAEAELSISELLTFDKKLLKIYGRIQAEQVTVARFHLHRADENTFHIYQDYGKSLKLMLALKLKSYIPIAGVNGRWSSGTVETDFYPISLHPSQLKIETLKSLRSSILALNQSDLSKVVTPHKVEHTVKEGGNTEQLFVLKRNQIDSNQSMKLTHALGGKKKEIHRRYDAVTTGVDYESYAIDAVNSLIAALTKSDLALSQVQTLNPGFTTGGSAKNRIFTSEYDGSRMTTNFQRIFNGWRVTPRDMKGYLDLMNKEAGRKIFDPITVINTNSILLYQISFTYNMAQEGVDKILSTSREKLKEVLLFYGFRHFEDEKIDNVVSSYFNSLQKIKKELAGKTPESGMERYHDWLKAFQDDVPITGLEVLAGKENIVYQGRIEGFRQGDENGDSPIFSNVYGELPLPLHATPTQAVMQNWGILEGELLANWMMERAI
jgi:hypothetical protein